ncbi:MAG TPA: DUF2752 domain-containing protein [Pyrinomonadaceae bacterium]|nr:DUF2752 domain-containing protein [Acidobacteriota bacterium]HQZ95673.1 DUF2752 domain-containing protein [Pyrinomonadaceae bacterium]
MQAEQNIPAIDLSPMTERIVAGLGAVVMVAGSGAVAYFDPAKASLFPVCPLFALTGCACPGCGLTRGFHALFRGDIITALDFNALIPLWALICGWVTVSLVLLAIRGRGLYMWPTRPKFMYAFMVVLVTFGVLRNIPAWPLTILFP